MGTSYVFQDYYYCWYKVSSGYLHKLKLLKGGDTEWEQVMSSKIIASFCWYKVSSGYLHKLKLLKGRDTEWEQVMFSKIIATAGTRLVLVTCTS